MLSTILDKILRGFDRLREEARALRAEKKKEALEAFNSKEAAKLHKSKAESYEKEVKAADEEEKKLRELEGDFSVSIEAAQKKSYEAAENAKAEAQLETACSAAASIADENKACVKAKISENESTMERVKRNIYDELVSNLKECTSYVEAASIFEKVVPYGAPGVAKAYRAWCLAHDTDAYRRRKRDARRSANKRRSAS